jgi:hypothetical protein
MCRHDAIDKAQFSVSSRPNSGPMIRVSTSRTGRSRVSSTGSPSRHARTRLCAVMAILEAAKFRMTRCTLEGPRISAISNVVAIAYRRSAFIRSKAKKNWSAECRPSSIISTQQHGGYIFTNSSVDLDLGRAGTRKCQHKYSHQESM